MTVKKKAVKRGRPPLSAAQKKRRAASRKVVNAKSQATRKAPTKRLKKRRAANKAKGYFPNPSHTGHLLGIRESNVTGGQFGYWTGVNWDTEIKNAVIYPTVKGAHSEISHLPARLKASRLYEYFSESVKVSVSPKTKGGTGRKSNPVPPSKYAKVMEAIDRFKEFTGHTPEFIDYIPQDKNDVAFKIGECDGVLYTTIRDGNVESYIHKFKQNNRPLLAASHDGKKLYILGGGYKFTERGIIG